MNPNRRQFLRLLGAGAASAGAGAGLANSAVAGTVAAQTPPIVEMGNNYFDPVGLHVEPGTTVRFEIAAGVHSATAYEDRIPAGAAAFDSGVISEGSYEHTFETPGTYDYYCIPHRGVGMVGRIVVGAPGGPAERSAIPDGSVPDSETIVEQGAVPYGSASSGVDGGDGGGGSDGWMMGPGMGPGHDGAMGPGHDGAMGPRHGGAAGPGMLGGRTGGWIGWAWLLGGALGLLGLLGAVAGALYLALRGTDAPGTSDDPALETLRRRYARGEIDEDEFRQRRDRLEPVDEATTD